MRNLFKAETSLVALAVGLAVVCVTTIIRHGALEDGGMRAVEQALISSNLPRDVVKGDFVICVGPVKTGSTYLQESLCNPQAQAILAKDNYAFRGTCLNASQVDGAVQRERNNTQTDVMRSVIPMMQGTRAHHGIFINELMTLHDQTDEFYVSSLAKAVRDTRFPDPIIVVNYRRFFEQYLSNFNQIQRPKGGKLGWPRPNTQVAGRGQEAQPFRTPHKLCNSDANATDLFYRIFCAHNASRTQVCRDLYSRSFQRVRVLDMHDPSASEKHHPAGDPYMQQFLCEAVPHAPHACAAAREGSIGAGARNPSQVLHYDAIAVLAWKRGWLGCSGIKFLKTRWLRRDAYVAIRDYQEKVLNLTWKDLPLVCPSESDLDEFLLLSLAYERQMFPASWKSRQSDHISAFWDAAANKKFCSVNATQVLEDDGWRDYIQSLGAGKPCGGKVKLRKQ